MCVFGQGCPRSLQQDSEHEVDGLGPSTGQHASRPGGLRGGHVAVPVDRCHRIVRERLPSETRLRRSTAKCSEKGPDSHTTGSLAGVCQCLICIVMFLRGYIVFLFCRIMSVSATEGSNGVTSVTSRFVVDERATPPIKKLYITYGDENGVLSVRLCWLFSPLSGRCTTELFVLLQVIEVFPQLSEHGKDSTCASQPMHMCPHITDLQAYPNCRCLGP